MDHPVERQGTIFIQLSGASAEVTERCREAINTLFMQGVFNIRNGSAELHFDHEGTLQVIRIHQDVYRRKSGGILHTTGISATVKTTETL